VVHSFEAAQRLVNLDPTNKELRALRWGNTGMLYRAVPCEASSEGAVQRSTIAGDEPWA